MLQNKIPIFVSGIPEETQWSYFCQKDNNFIKTGNLEEHATDFDENKNVWIFVS